MNMLAENEVNPATDATVSDAVVSDIASDATNTTELDVAGLRLSATQLRENSNKKLAELPVSARQRIHESLKAMSQASEENARQVVKLNKVHYFALQALEAVAPATACKPQCTACCHGEIVVTMDEAARIAAKVGKKIDITPYKKQETLKKIESHRGKPCTFLVDGLCSIYAERPLICKVRVNISDYPQLCGAGSSVPALELNALWKVLSASTKKDKIVVKDIRDFFTES